MPSPHEEWPFGGTGSGWRLMKVEYPTAAEEHLCEACGASIMPGETYQKEVFRWGNSNTVAHGKVHLPDACPLQEVRRSPRSTISEY